MDNALMLGLFLPLAGFLILLFTSYRIGRQLTGLIACSTVFVSFLCFSALLYLYTIHHLETENLTLFRWIPIDRINTHFTLHLDHLSLLMALIITGIGFLIHIYSNGYMDHEEDYARYFACLNFFIFAMLLLVLAGNLLLLFVGWEGVGLASYLLIGFWYERPAAAKAATKAFVVNRIGDFGFLIGLLLTFYLFGTSDLAEINQRAGKEFAIGAPILTVLTFLYFWAATGKSAQIPLHVWLPDAMEGPTPVSALIHAATMVTAGVYLVVRMHPLFLMTPLTSYVIGIVGGVTALFAALCAIGQIDLKRVLAYSTISQLGLMFLACGVGAFYAAMFHLTMHAFVKGLLFLSAGNIVHMMHGTTDMRKMGDLSKIFTKTHWLFLIGVFGLSGIPPIGAFFSKDLILEQEYEAGFKVFFYVGLAASILTAFYLTRAYCLTFKGVSHVEEKIRRLVKEAPMIMLAPVILLAIFSLIGGFIGFSTSSLPVLENFLINVGGFLPENNGSFQFTPEIWLSIAGALFGVGAAAILYTRYVNQLAHSLQILRKSFFVDEFYEKFIVLPLKAFSQFIVGFLEPTIFEGSIRGTAHLIQKAAVGLQRIQSGQIRSYIAWMVVGMVFLFVYLIF